MRIETAAQKFNLESIYYSSLPKAIDFCFYGNSRFPLQLDHSFYSNCDVTRDNGFLLGLTI
jgi:hypothetical protein